MKNSRLRLIVKLVFCLLIAVGAYFWANALMDSIYAYRSPLDKQPPVPGARIGDLATRRVIWVLVDGLRTDTAADPDVMPVLNRLRAEGAYANMHSKAPTYSAPSYSVLLTGAWQEISSGPAFNLDYEDLLPLTQDNIFAAAQRAGMHTAISGYYWFEKLLGTDQPDEAFYTSGDDRYADDEVMVAALPMVEGEAQLVLIHLDQVDYAGHHEGGGRSAGWNAAASRVDAMLEQIVDRMDLKQDTLLVLSDHGHIDRGGHGGQERIVMTEPFILCGAGVKPGVYGDMQMVDVAPTLAALLGTNLPASAQGEPLTEMLNLPDDTLVSLPGALAQQQRGLVSAYLAYFEKTPDLEKVYTSQDAQPLMDAARSARLNATRVWRIPLVALFWIGLAVIWHRTCTQPANKLLVGALAAIALFHLGHIVDGRTYSYSSLGGAMDLIMFGAVSGGVALVVAWFGLFLWQRWFRQSPAGVAETTLDLALTTIFLTSLIPAVYSALNGPQVTWFLPDMGLHYLTLLSMVQILMSAVFGLLLSGVGAITARLRKTTTSV